MKVDPDPDAAIIKRYSRCLSNTDFLVTNFWSFCLNLKSISRHVITALCSNSHNDLVVGLVVHGIIADLKLDPFPVRE